MNAHPSRPDGQSYFEHAFSAFPSGQAETRESNRSYHLTGRTSRIEIAGAKLAEILTPAFSHLKLGMGTPDLTIRCWDAAATKRGLPPLPDPAPTIGEFKRYLSADGEELFRVHIDGDGNTVRLYEPASRRAIFWTRNAAELWVQHYSSPLVEIIHWWGQSHSLLVLHAASVGTDKGAILLPGKNGAGKSTCALLCAEAGLGYLSDDYVLVSPSPQPTAYCLFSTGKLNEDHLKQFPKLAAVATSPAPQAGSKHLINLERHFGAQVRSELPLRAVVIPSITGNPDTWIQTASAGEAIRALAPSTLFQFPGPDATSFQRMAELVRSLPIYRIGLGTRLNEIAPTLGSLINRESL